MGEMADYCEDGALQAMADMADMEDMEDKRTFEEWNKAGFRIENGSKSVGRNEHGVPLFDRTQVYEDDFDDYEDVSGGA